MTNTKKITLRIALNFVLEKLTSPSSCLLFILVPQDIVEIFTNLWRIMQAIRRYKSFQKTVKVSKRLWKDQEGF